MTWKRFWRGAIWASVMLPVVYLLGFEWSWRLAALLFASSLTDALLSKAPALEDDRG